MHRHRLGSHLISSLTRRRAPVYARSCSCLDGTPPSCHGRSDCGIRREFSAPMAFGALIFPGITRGGRSPPPAREPQMRPFSSLSLIPCNTPLPPGNAGGSSCSVWFRHFAARQLLALFAPRRMSALMGQSARGAERSVMSPFDPRRGSERSYR